MTIAEMLDILNKLKNEIGEDKSVLFTVDGVCDASVYEPVGYMIDYDIADGETPIAVFQIY